MKLRVTQKHLKESTQYKCLFDVAFEKVGIPAQVGYRSVWPSHTSDKAFSFSVSKRARKMIDLFDYSFSDDKEKAASCRAALRKMLPTTVVFKEISQ